MTYNVPEGSVDLEYARGRPQVCAGPFGQTLARRRPFHDPDTQLVHVSLVRKPRSR